MQRIGRSAPQPDQPHRIACFIGNEIGLVALHQITPDPAIKRKGSRAGNPVAGKAASNRHVVEISLGLSLGGALFGLAARCQGRARHQEAERLLSLLHI